MNNTKSPKNVSLKNQLELWLFCALIGAVAGALVWILLKIMAVGTEFLLITLFEFWQIRISTKYDICRFLIFHEDVLRFFLLFVIFFFYDEFTVREVDIFRRLRSYSR